MHDHLHEIVAHLLQLALLAQALLERVRRGLELEQTSNTGAKDEAIVRLGEKIVAAGFDRLHAIGGVVERRDEDDGNVLRARIALDAPANLEAGGSIVAAEITGRHRHVEDTEIGLALEAGAER